MGSLGRGYSVLTVLGWLTPGAPEIHGSLGRLFVEVDRISEMRCTLPKKTETLDKTAELEYNVFTSKWEAFHV